MNDPAANTMILDVWGFPASLIKRGPNSLNQARKAHLPLCAHEIPIAIINSVDDIKLMASTESTTGQLPGSSSHKCAAQRLS